MSDSGITSAPAPPPNQPAGSLGSASGLAIASMVLGIVGIVFAFLCYPIGFVLAIVGLPLGGVALSKINKGTVKPDGKGQAITGVVLSIITLAIALIMMFVVGAALSGF
jgi:uncharacterized membrane protein